MPPISATRTSEPPARVRGGFTLVEILVVVLVVAIFAGLAVVNLGGRDRGRVLEGEAERLRTTLMMARDRALLDAREWGLALEPEGYRYLIHDRAEARWEAAGARPFTFHELPSDIRVELHVEDRRLAPSRLPGDDADAGRRPSLLILSSGEMTPFELNLVPAWDGRGLRLASDGLADPAIEPMPR